MGLFSKTENAVSKFQKELNSGIVGLIVLCILDRHGEQYGYDIVRLLADGETDVLPMNQHAVYPVLRSLEKQKLLSSRMQASEVGPPRKYYRVTSEGKVVLHRWKEVWSRSVGVVNRILSENNHERPSFEGDVSRKVPSRTGSRR